MTLLYGVVITACFWCAWKQENTGFHILQFILIKQVSYVSCVKQKAKCRFRATAISLCSIKIDEYSSKIC
jgi:hypothetical protein